MPAIAVPANLAFDTYDELVAAINDWLDRSDLTGVAQQMIALCEARLRRQLVPYFSETSASVVTDAAGIGSLPADYSTLRRVIYDTKTLPNVSVAGGFSLTSGTVPAVYSLEAGGLRVWPAISATITILYQPTLPQLSSGTPTNDMLSKHPDLYFYGSLMFALGYEANDSRAAMFKSLWDEAIYECQQYLIRQRHGGELIPRVSSVP